MATVLELYYLGTSEYAAGSIGSSASSFGLYPRKKNDMVQYKKGYSGTNMQGYQLL